MYSYYCTCTCTYKGTHTLRVCVHTCKSVYEGMCALIMVHDIYVRIRVHECQTLITKYHSPAG